jgi:asparaginyl-tRNA synthetase
MSKDPFFSTPLGAFSREKFAALLKVREAALDGLRRCLKGRGYSEVTVATLVNVAGSCESPYSSFTLPYYGRAAHLSQSAQLQLEALVIRLGRGFFTVNSSFREEHFEDPEAAGRRLSEFTLVEPERPFPGLSAVAALEELIGEIEGVVKSALADVLKEASDEVVLLGGNIGNLQAAVAAPFCRVSYEEALRLLNSKGLGPYTFGDDLGIREERVILAHFDNTPTFLTRYPAHLKFFNIKRTADERLALSVDLLAPRLGETVGGAVREQDGVVIKRQLMQSNIARYAQEKGFGAVAPFQQYFDLFADGTAPLRAGYGVGFERFVAFVLGCNDILQTVAYRVMQP